MKKYINSFKKLTSEGKPFNVTSCKFVMRYVAKLEVQRNSEHLLTRLSSQAVISKGCGQSVLIGKKSMKKKGTVRRYLVKGQGKAKKSYTSISKVKVYGLYKLQIYSLPKRLEER